MSSSSAGHGQNNSRTDEPGADGRSIVTRSPEQTFALGAVMGGAAVGGTVLCLFGDLGSGKTKLTQGLAAGLTVPKTYAVTSPTFTYVNEYPGRLALYHIDLYRISSPDELLDLGWEEYMWADGVVAVEWAERAGEYLPEKRIDIAITITGTDERRFDITFNGEHAAIDAALISRTHER
ncbi:MAG: tRNA (adenosine(37)-N6)-threonylcarbamoyltransferase complex ATPase subunit type 1 TsaE [Deltaproteobacteria bacterium]|nr:tRNA (adenosine(37)-N6)-threonylcarbamoyltransferase complex ATPase subunit type 1 TsaE [Candidatus Zymogenaceae bacterium]